MLKPLTLLLLTTLLPLSAAAQPSFSVDPTSLAFEVEEGQVSAAQSFTLSNDGAGAGSFSVSVSNTTPRGITPDFAPVDPIVTLNGTEEAALFAQLARSSVVHSRANVTVMQRDTPELQRGGGNPGDLLASTSTTGLIGGIGQTPDGTIYLCGLEAQAPTETFTYDVDGASFTQTGAFTQPGDADTNITGCTYFPDGNGGDGALWYLNPDLGAGTAKFIETDLAGTPTGTVVPLVGLTGAGVPIGLSYNEATGLFFFIDIVNDDIIAVNPDGTVADGYPVPQTCLDTGGSLFGNALDALGSGLDVLAGLEGDGRPTRVQVTEFDGSCRQGDDGDLFTPIEVTTDQLINAVLRDRRAPNEVLFLGASNENVLYAVTPAERGALGSFVIVSPESGDVDAGSSQEISVSVDATDLAPGEYSAQVIIETNDPANPTLVVDLDITVTTGPISNEEAGTPTEFSVGQNYPNPFAGATTIDFALPEAARVTVTVYDAVGRRVATLVDQDLTPGYHSASWDTRGLASGVYLYRIQAGDFVQTQKMSLVR